MLLELGAGGGGMLAFADGVGVPRMLLRSEGGGDSSFTLRDTNGASLMDLSSDSRRTALTMYGPNGKAHMAIDTVRGGLPGLRFFAWDGVTALAELGVTEKDTPSLIFRNVKGETTWEAGAE